MTSDKKVVFGIWSVVETKCLLEEIKVVIYKNVLLSNLLCGNKSWICQEKYGIGGNREQHCLRP